jgi:urea transport system substrate-binding protein
MGRRLLIGLGLLAALAVTGYVAAWALGAEPAGTIAGLVAGTRPPIVVGLLHSQTGPLEISERSLIDAERMAVEEINDRGGVAGRRIEVRTADGRSDASAFASEARRLIDAERVSAIFGAYASECRRAVRAVVEERRGLLFLPGKYEGLEGSPRVIYAGGSANQYVPPVIRWAMDTLKSRRFFVVGSEEVWSRSVAEVAKDSIRAAGAELAGESYLPMNGSDVGAMVEAIKGARADAVLSSILGDSNLPFYSALRREGLTPERLPVISYSVAEDELRQLPPGDVTGHYAAWNYFQSVDRPANREFVRRFRARFGDDRVTSDPIVAAYNSVMIWAQTVDELGSPEPGTVIEHLGRQSFNAPDAIVTVDPESNVCWRLFHIGRARPDGQFDVVYSITKPVRPMTFFPTRSSEQWRAFLDGLRAGWGGRDSSASASAPAPAPVGPPTPPDDSPR